jgi:hypothetical protein
MKKLVFACGTKEAGLDGGWVMLLLDAKCANEIQLGSNARASKDPFPHGWIHNRNCCFET